MAVLAQAEMAFLQNHREVVALSEELGVSRRLLYRWRHQLDPVEVSRGSTSEERRIWREGVYDQIREVMSMQGSLSIERMCYLTQVSRAGLYRSLAEHRARTPQDSALQRHATPNCGVDRPTTT